MKMTLEWPHIYIILVSLNVIVIHVGACIQVFLTLTDLLKKKIKNKSCLTDGGKKNTQMLLEIIMHILVLFLSAFGHPIFMVYSFVSTRTPRCLTYKYNVYQCAVYKWTFSVVYVHQQQQFLFHQSKK